MPDRPLSELLPGIDLSAIYVNEAGRITAEDPAVRDQIEQLRLSGVTPHLFDTQNASQCTCTNSGCGKGG